MSNRPTLVVANRKMHGNLPENQHFMQTLLQHTARHLARYAVCPPHPYLFQAQQLLQQSHIAWGAQNMSRYERGAYTGSVSPSMLREFGCTYVIIGHSERRQRGHDNDETCGERFEAALKAGLTPILCIGETLDEYEQGETDVVVSRQLNPVISHVGIQALSQGVIAYEPVWAIGTGKAASPQHVQAILSFVRGHIALLNPKVSEDITLLYGGSVQSHNAAQLLSLPDVDGSLVGGASLQVEEFLRITDIANAVAA